MASSWPQTPATPSTSSLSHLPCIRAFYLSDTTASAVLDVAQAVKHDREESGQHVLLAFRTLSEAKTWSLVLLSSSSWAKVSNLRTQLISESDAVCFHLSFPPVPVKHLTHTDLPSSYPPSRT